MRSGIYLLVATGLAVVLLLSSAARPAAGQAAGSEQYQGVVWPSKQVELAAPLQGVLKAVTVEESQAVKADQVLFQMDDTLQKVAVASAKMQYESDTNIRQTELQLQDAQLNLENAEKIQKTGYASDWEVRRQRVQRDLAEVAVEAAKQQQELAGITLQAEQERLERYSVKAPFDGQIAKKLIEPGATVTETDKVLMVVALDPLEARIDLPTYLFGQLQVGERYKLAAGEPVNRQLVGTVKTIHATMDSASETFRCIFTIDNPGSKLPSGFPVFLSWPQQPLVAQQSVAEGQ